MAAVMAETHVSNQAIRAETMLHAVRRAASLSLQRAMSLSTSISSRKSLLLITPSALSTALKDKQRAANIRIIDATWFMPNVSRNGRDEFLAGPRINAAAGFWDVDAVADHSHKVSIRD